MGSLSTPASRVSLMGDTGFFGDFTDNRGAGGLADLDPTSG